MAVLVGDKKGATAHLGRCLASPPPRPSCTCFVSLAVARMAGAWCSLTAARLSLYSHVATMRAISAARDDRLPASRANHGCVCRVGRHRAVMSVTAMTWTA